MRIVLAFALVACGGGKGGVLDESCQLEELLAREAPADATPCGMLLVQATDADRMTARSCVMTQLAENRNFVVSWNIQGIDSRVARAFYRDGLALRAVFYDGDPAGGGGELRPSASTSSCASIVATPTCTSDELKTTLCLTCTQSAPVDTCSTLEQ